MAFASSLDKVRRVGINFFLGFSSGLPIALCGSTLQAWLASAHVSLIAIGFATLIGQPYAYKFLWAPFMDKYIPPFLGKRRGWMLLTQLLLILTLILLSQLEPNLHLTLMLSLALALAFFSASQDLTVDAYRTEILEESERGFGASLTTIGYQIALVISGGMALGMANFWGWKLTYLVMSSLMLIGVFASLLAKDPISSEKSTSSHGLLQPFIQLIKKFSFKTFVWIVLVLVFYKLGDALILTLNSTFLLQGLHFSLLQIGIANKTVGLLSAIAGGFVGGLLLIRISLFKALILFGLLQAFSNVGFWILAHVGHDFPLMIFVMGISQFCSGLGTVALLALLMKLCDKEYSATQYALLSAMASLGRIYVGPLAALLVKNFGWELFYFLAFLSSFPGVFLIFSINKLLKDRPTTPNNPSRGN